jgi:hypothetical protein
MMQHVRAPLARGAIGDARCDLVRKHKVQPSVARRFVDAMRRGERKFQPSNVSLLPTQAKVSRSGLIKDLSALLGMMRHSTAT